MRRSHLPTARRGALLVLLAALSVAAAGCSPRSRELQPGSYRAVLELPGGNELPFGLDVAREEHGLVLYLVNGKERLRVPEASVREGRLTARLPGGANALSARISGGDLDGEVTLIAADGRQQVLPMQATLGQAWRFVEEPPTDNADFAGRWSVTFTTEGGAKRPGVAELTQSFASVSGTIRTRAGEQRFLAGDAQDEELRLSQFDGTEAHLYVGRLNERGALVGEHWSGGSGHERFVALRNPDAVLDAVPAANGPN